MGEFLSTFLRDCHKESSGEAFEVLKNIGKLLSGSRAIAWVALGECLQIPWGYFGQYLVAKFLGVLFELLAQVFRAVLGDCLGESLGESESCKVFACDIA